MDIFKKCYDFTLADQYKEMGIEILQFDSDFMQSRKAVGA